MSRCSCCGGNVLRTPSTVTNRPGLTALQYRAGTHASFFHTMKEQLSSQRYPILENLTTRDSHDFSLAMLDAWSLVGDILTFYQERIANEGFLRTARERRSIVELARLVDYHLRPGVAASVYVAYVLEQDAETMIPMGSRVQSVPKAEEIPQIFETSTKLIAKAVWNTVRPRLRRPSIPTRQTQTLYVQGTNHNLEPNDPLLFLQKTLGDEGPPLTVPKRIKTIETDFKSNRTKVVFQNAPVPTQALLKVQGTFDSLQTLVTPLSKAPSGHPKNRWRLSRRPQNVFSPQSEIVPRLLEDFHPQIRYSLSDAVSQARVAPESSTQVVAFRAKNAPFGHNASMKPVVDPVTGGIVGSEEWALAGVSYSIEMTPVRHVVQSTNSHQEDHPFANLKATISLGRGSQKWSHTFLLGDDAGNLTSFPKEFSLGNAQVTATLDLGDLLRSFQIKFSNPSKAISFLWEDEGGQGPGEGEPGIRVRIDEMLPIPIQNEQKFLTRLGDMQEQVVSLALGSFSTQGFRVFAEVVAPSAPPEKRLVLDGLQEKILPDSWVLIERPNDEGTRERFDDDDPREQPDADGPRERPDEPAHLITKVTKVSQVSKNEYGLSGRVTQMELEDDWLNPDRDFFLDAIRNVTVYAQPEVLELADEPVSEPVEGSHITLDGYYPELEPGRWLIVEGDRVDIPNAEHIPGKELVMLSAVEHEVGYRSIDQDQLVADREEEGAVVPLPGDTLHTTLILSESLAYMYERESVKIYGNVVHATQGETGAQILGSADASTPFQRFTLSQTPLTFVSAPTEEGVESSLNVRVNNVLWEEVDNLVFQGPEDRVFMTQRNAEGDTSIVFGDGRNGLRPTTGIENVSSSFRIGIGPSGNVEPKQISVAVDRPLGVQEVLNPLAATGGSNPESGARAKRNVPRGLRTLGRVVSLEDYENFTCSFAGIGKAKAALMRHPHQEVVHLTIAGVDDAPLDEQSDVFQNLLLALARFGDGQQEVQLAVRERLLLVLKANIRLHEAYLWEKVAPDLRVDVLEALSFENRDLGEPVYLSKIIWLMQRHKAVQQVAIEIFDVLNKDFSEDVLKKLYSNPKISQAISVRLAQQASKGFEISPAQIAYMSSNIPDTLILNVMD